MAADRPHERSTEASEPRRLDPEQLTSWRAIMDDAERTQRIERRRRVVALIKAMANSDAAVDDLVTQLAGDEDVKRVVGALGLAGSTLAKSLAQASGRSPDDVLDELEKAFTSAPVE
jgi:hypothetical protein